MRLIDDKIIYMLNTTIPTDSFKGQVDATSKCKDLYEQIRQTYSERERAITKCLHASKEKVKQLKSQRESENGSLSVIKVLRAEQNRLRLLQAELNVEDVIKTRTEQIFYEKCRTFYKPQTKI